MTFCHRHRGAALIASTLLAPQALSAAEKQGGGVLGWVENTQGVPVAGAVISLFGKGIRGGSLVTLSDTTGQFFLPSLPAGSYTLRALGRGHEPAPAQTITVLPQKDSVFTVSLTPVGESGEGASESPADSDRTEADRVAAAREELKWLLRHKRRSVLEYHDDEVIADVSAESPAPDAEPQRSSGRLRTDTRRHLRAPGDPGRHRRRRRPHRRRRRAHEPWGPPPPRQDGRDRGMAARGPRHRERKHGVAHGRGVRAKPGRRTRDPDGRRLRHALRTPAGGGGPRSDPRRTQRGLAVRPRHLARFRGLDGRVRRALLLRGLPPRREQRRRIREPRARPGARRPHARLGVGREPWHRAATSSPSAPSARRPCWA